MSPREPTAKSSFATLQDLVIDKDLCMLCHGCVASCPVDAIEIIGESVSLTGDCVECGTCYRICPGKGYDFSKARDRLFGRREKGIRERFHGVHLSGKNLRSSDDEVFRAGYVGGRVSTILIHALEEALIDAALTTDWGEGNVLSVGSGRTCRDRASVLECSSSKYLFSPVLTLLKEVQRDPDIERIAVVGLPCHIQALRNMQSDKSASRYTEKVVYALSLNCGAPNLTDENWRSLIGRIMGVSGEGISRVDIRKVKGRTLRFRVRMKDGTESVRDRPLSEYMRMIRRYPRWPRCDLCIDYSGELSDISFGNPLARTEKGKALLDGAVKSGKLVPGSRDQAISQFAIDIYGYLLKKVGAKRRVRRRRRKGEPHPEYRC